MKLIVSSDNNLIHIQHQFNIIFPYLKLMFFTPGENSGSRETQIKTNQIVSDFVKLEKTIEIPIDENEIVKEVEKKISEHLKINVQIFRKSGESWLQTRHTDSWTLKAQNEEGKKITGFIDHKGNEEKVNPLDRDVFE